MQTYESLKSFISCPKDVNEEYRMAQEVIDAVSSTCKETLGIELETVTFDDFVPQAPRLPEERIQDILNAEIPKCHIFILILGKRYGSLEPGHRMSNTAREVETAIALLKKEKKLMFLSYFHEIEKDDDPGTQQQSVEEFRKSLEQRGIWYRRFTSSDDFKNRLTHDLYRTVMRYRLSTNKHQFLRRFWKFGTPDRPTYPALAVMYPAMERTFMGPQDDPDVWLNRLEPNIVFEDFKALQKIDKTLRLIGFDKFRIYNSASAPSDIRFMNRFWICLRNSRGLQQASLYKDISRFTIVPKKNRASSFFCWKPRTNSDNFIIIKSPLAKYLREQRSKLDISGEWQPEMDHIMAKDFAILARFQDMHNNIHMQDGYLQDYFLAGLRGLGTWGAAWFIDRKYHTFEPQYEKRDIQFLLEVEYRDGRIFDVRDVSNKGQDYFDEENGISQIRNNIADYKSLLRKH